MLALLQVDRISKTYPPRGKQKGPKQALKEVSFSLHQGEVLGLLGENGAGKTTLSSIIASLHPPTTGAVLWNGTNILHNLLGYRATIGFCPQTQNIDYHFTVEETLTFQGHAYGLSPASTQASVAKWLQKLGLEPYAGASPRVLSGGYKQRFLIARAVIHNPKIILLDEPTVGLDPQARMQLWDCIVALKQEGSSVVLTTHYLDEAEKLADRICVLDHGVIKAIGDVPALLQQSGAANLETFFLSTLNPSTP